MIEVCLKRIFIAEIDMESRRCLLEGLKDTVRELSFAGGPGVFGGSLCRVCGVVVNKEHAKRK